MADPQGKSAEGGSHDSGPAVVRKDSAMIMDAEEAGPEVQAYEVPAEVSSPWDVFNAGTIDARDDQDEEEILARLQGIQWRADEE